MSDRPRGVFWARRGPAARDGLCEDATHGVYLRRVVRERRSDDGETVRRTLTIYACAVCWPDDTTGDGLWTE